MNEEQTALARRAVACKGFRWMPGMRTNSKFARVVAVDSGTGAPCASEEGATNDDCHAVWLDGVPLLPDLSDAATLGCLLALVRKAWGQEPTGFIVPTHAGGWSYYTTLIAADWYPGDTEAEALVAALEAAP